MVNKSQKRKKKRVEKEELKKLKRLILGIFSKNSTGENRYSPQWNIFSLFFQEKKQKG
jgi:hypothetical protein